MSEQPQRLNDHMRQQFDDAIAQIRGGEHAQPETFLKLLQTIGGIDTSRFRQDIHNSFKYDHDHGVVQARGSLGSQRVDFSLLFHNPDEVLLRLDRPVGEAVAASLQLQIETTGDNSGVFHSASIGLLHSRRTQYIPFEFDGTGKPLYNPAEPSIGFEKLVSIFLNPDLHIQSVDEIRFIINASKR